MSWAQQCPAPLPRPLPASLHTSRFFEQIADTFIGRRRLSRYQKRNPRVSILLVSQP